MGALGAVAAADDEAPGPDGRRPRPCSLRAPPRPAAGALVCAVCMLLPRGAGGLVRPVCTPPHPRSVVRSVSAPPRPRAASTVCSASPRRSRKGDSRCSACTWARPRTGVGVFFVFACSPSRHAVRAACSPPRGPCAGATAFSISPRRSRSGATRCPACTWACPGTGVLLPLPCSPSRPAVRAACSPPRAPRARGSACSCCSPPRPRAGCPVAPLHTSWLAPCPDGRRERYACSASAPPPTRPPPRPGCPLLLIGHLERHENGRRRGARLNPP